MDKWLRSNKTSVFTCLLLSISLKSEEAFASLPSAALTSFSDTQDF